MYQITTTVTGAMNSWATTMSYQQYTDNRRNHMPPIYNAPAGRNLSSLTKFVTTATTDDSMSGGLGEGEEAESEYVPYNQRPETYIVPIVFAIIFFVGIIGNGLLIYAVLSHKTLRNNAPNIYILNLSLGDFGLILISVPFTSTIYTFESWPYGTILCKTTEFWRALSVAVSVYTLTALSADRYHAIVDPLGRYVGGRKTVRRTLLTCGAIWIAGAAFASLDAINSYVLVLPRYEESGEEGSVISPSDLFNVTMNSTLSALLAPYGSRGRGLTTIGDIAYQNVTSSTDPKMTASLFVLLITGHFKTVVDFRSIFKEWFPNLDYQHFRTLLASATPDPSNPLPRYSLPVSADQILKDYSVPLFYLVNSTLLPLATTKNLGPEQAPLKVCYPYPERYGENYKKGHTLIKFLLLLVVPFSIITVYYVLMAKRLIMSTTDVPNDGYSASVDKRNTLLKDNDCHRYSSPESSTPFLVQTHPNNSPLTRDKSHTSSNGHGIVDDRSLDQTLKSGASSPSPAGHSPLHSPSDLQVPYPEHGNNRVACDKNNGLLSKWNVMAARGSTRLNSILSIGLSPSASDTLCVSRSVTSSRNQSTLTIDNGLVSTPASTVGTDSYINRFRGSFSYWKRKLSTTGQPLVRNFMYTARMNKQMDSRKKVAKMVLIVVLLFLICWLPHHVFNMWFHFDHHALEKYNYAWHSLKLIGFILSYLNSCVNPIALYFISNTYHKYFNQYLSLRCLCGKKSGANKGSSVLKNSETLRVREFSRQNTFNRTFKHGHSDKTSRTTISSVHNDKSVPMLCTESNGTRHKAKNHSRKMVRMYEKQVPPSPINKSSNELGPNDSFFDLTLKKRKRSSELITTASISL